MPNSNPNHNSRIKLDITPIGDAGYRVTAIGWDGPVTQYGWWLNRADGWNSATLADLKSILQEVGTSYEDSLDGLNDALDVLEEIRQLV